MSQYQKGPDGSSADQMSINVLLWLSLVHFGITKTHLTVAK